MGPVVEGSEVARPSGPTAGLTTVVLLAFEGPDAYSRRGDLAEQTSGLARSCAEAGFTTILIFVGDPEAAHEEVVATAAGGSLRLVRWSQWISRYYPGGPYEDQDARVLDYTAGVPRFVGDLEAVGTLARAAEPGVPGMVVLAYEWQTVGALLGIDAELRRRHTRQHAVLTWTIRHPMNLGRVDVGAVARTCSIATISRYMKHELWKDGLDPLVFPPGIDAEHFEAPPSADLEAAQALAADRLLLFCPVLPPAWQPAVYSAVSGLKRGGGRPLLVVGTPASGADPAENLRIAGFGSPAATVSQSDVLIAAAPPTLAVRRALYATATATLLLGDDDSAATTLLAAMAGGAVALTDAAMSDPLVPFENGVALETRATAELSAALVELARDGERVALIRANARATAAGYTWPRTLATLLVKLSFLSGRH